MKKLLSLIFSLLITTSFCLVLGACGGEHTHPFKTTWESNDTHHWHNCTEASCLEVGEMGEHEWENNKCSVCGKEKPASEGMSEQNWINSIAESKFENVTGYYTLSTADVKNEHVVKIAGDRVLRSLKVINPADNQVFFEESFIFTGDQAKEQKKMFLQVLLALLAERSNFIYDAETNFYIAPQKISTTIVVNNEEFTETMENGKVQFDAEGRLSFFTCLYSEQSQTLGGITGDMSFSFADYGTTVIPEEE